MWFSLEEAILHNHVGFSGFKWKETVAYLPFAGEKIA